MIDYGKTIDGLERLRFFNQRAGRELWADAQRTVTGSSNRQVKKTLICFNYRRFDRKQIKLNQLIR